MWNIQFHYIEPWLDTLDERTVAAIFAALERLAEHGPALGRPLVDTLSQTTIKNLKELRPPSPGSAEIRILFAFDPERQAILLVGGDKSQGKTRGDRWAGWYRRAIPLAEQLFKQHLEHREAHHG